jgi:hypothetical protein
MGLRMRAELQSQRRLSEKGVVVISEKMVEVPVCNSRGKFNLYRKLEYRMCLGDFLRVRPKAKD